MAVLATIESVELFHLLLLSHLGQVLDKRHYALKGGCNFRFFFSSIRYSEDMDFDVQSIAVSDLRHRVNRVLASKPFRQALAARKLDIGHVAESKQTETTQRWKFGLISPSSSLPIATKVEFSRRRSFGTPVLEGVDPLLLRSLGLPALLACHYPAGDAWRQKIGALAHRSIVQARDLFDLYLLLASGKVDPSVENRSVAPATLQAAEQRGMSIRFDAFKSQVLSYLAPGHQPDYDSPDLWDTIVLRVSEALRRTS
jgi:predicted nucleotidyltransferase component of viral defense system